MACVLLDLLVASSGGVAELSEVIKVACEEKRSGSKEALTGLTKLFRCSFRSWVRFGSEKRRAWGETYRTRLVPNAAVYVCWYSQLRELIDEHPELATKLAVAPLPGGGVKGDWYLGVAAGSVSMKLGINVLKILCSDSEEYKRFVRGVGLPVRKKYDHSTFLGWPRAEPGTLLSTVLEIHKAALSRSAIGGYQRSRAALGTLGLQLAYLEAKEADIFVGSCLDRLGEMVRFLSGEPGNAKR
jgi:hypothetical protein